MGLKELGKLLLHLRRNSEDCVHAQEQNITMLFFRLDCFENTSIAV